MRRILPVVGLALLAGGCSVMFAGTRLQLVSNGASEAVLEPLYERYGVPLVLIGDAVYVPPQACLPERLFGADAEGRRVGGDAEGRRLGGDVDERLLGLAYVGRDFGGGVKGRRGGGDAEGRLGGGDAEGRRYGGAVLGRRGGGDMEGRRLGADVAHRQLGLAAVGREFGGGVRGRRGGGDADGRQLGGDALARLLGGGSAAYTCEMLADESGFRVKSGRSLEMRVYDGALRPADGAVVKF